MRRLVMDGPVPARVPDRVIAEIRSRERAGLIELPKLGLEPGMRVRVISGPLCEQIGLLGCFASAGWAAAGRAREGRDRGG